MALDPNKTITQYSVQVWDMEAGLPGNDIFAIRQTQEGYLWLGTQDGLVRFDGIDFEVFNRENTPQLKDNVIRALCQDGNGALWIGTTSGGLTRYEEGEFTHYPIKEHNALHDIRAIEEDRWGNLWIGSLTRGLTCLNNGQFTTYTTSEGLPDNKVRFIHKDGNRDIWVATEAGIVKILKPGLFQLYLSQASVPFLKTACLYKEEANELWIGTGQGLFRIKNGMVKVYGVDAGLPHPTVTYLYLDTMKNLWIGTDGGGLTRMNRGVFTTLPGGGGLEDGHVYSIYQDREESLWVGTVGGGLHQLRDSKFTIFTTREGLSHDYINCIYQTRNRDLWIGTDSGLNQLKKGRVIFQLTTTNGLLSNTILSLFEDSVGYLWIGTWKGLHRFRDGKLTTFTTKDGLSDNRINYIFEDKQGDTWIGTENGLNRLDNAAGKITVFTTKQGLSSNFIVFIFEDSKGNFRIGTDAGLNCLKHGRIIKCSQAGMENLFFQCAYEDKQGVLWFGTDSGLLRKKENQTTRYTIQSGLIDNYVYFILEDENGYLWLAGRNGISRISKKELEDFSIGTIARVQPDWYNEKHGMKSRWCTGTGCKTQDGRFWFPTKVGAAVIDPNHIKTNSLVPSPIIKKLVVDGQPINIKSFLGGSGGRFYKKAPLAAGGILELAPGKKRVEFYFTGVSFVNPQKIRFKIKLEGYDRTWVDIGNVRSTTYTGLSPKKYTFMVKACNSDGEWNEKVAAFSFYLKPYFTQTTWFYLFIVLFVLLAAFSFYRFRVGQLKRREKELGKLVEMRTREVEDKNRQLQDQSEKLKEMDKVKSRFFANISHEFRTPLTLIMGPLEQMMADSGDNQQKKKLNLMLRNSQRLLRLINQLLGLSKFESGKVKLQACRQNVIPLLKGTVANFESLADKHELDLIFHAEAEDITLYLDVVKLEDVLYNLLINAVKFTPAGGKITVSAKEIAGKDEGFPDGWLQLSVSDTGPGIPREQLAHIFDRFYQADTTYEHREKGTGIGLALVKELVRIHHGKIDVYSREGKGTEFIIALPMGDAHLEPDEIVDSPESPTSRKVPVEIPASDIRAGIDETETPTPTEDFEASVPGKDIILVVEDSADMREYIKGSLELLYTVVEANDGEEGLKKAKESIPDLIISDIMMPGMDGYELCNSLKKDIKTSHIPIILLTAKASEESIVRGLETGADDYITKPFSTQILMARIKNLIDLRRQLQLNITREMSLQPDKISVSRIDREFIKELKGVINKNLADPDFNVEQLARKLYMDRSTIYRKILALTGETPTDFIRSCRLKRGAELLKDNFGTVLEVAFEVGFSSANYFTKCFKKKFHQLPSNFKEIE
jgi:signal transduction histidine kinase/ligand-binding sensor domain-containing protein/DNA-binding NarL/FixJ family response regulator